MAAFDRLGLHPGTSSRFAAAGLMAISGQPAPVVEVAAEDACRSRQVRPYRAPARRLAYSRNIWDLGNDRCA